MSGAELDISVAIGSDNQPEFSWTETSGNIFVVDEEAATINFTLTGNYKWPTPVTELKPIKISQLDDKIVTNDWSPTVSESGKVLTIVDRMSEANLGIWSYCLTIEDNQGNLIVSDPRIYNRR